MSILQWQRLGYNQSLQSQILVDLMAPTKDKEEDSDLTVDSSEIQGQCIPHETKVDMKQDQKTQNEPEIAVVSAMTTGGSSELEATVVTTVAEEVAEVDVDDMKQDQEAVVETTMTTEELESGTTRDMVTDSGTGSQGDQWVKIGDRI